MTPVLSASRLLAGDLRDHAAHLAVHGPLPRPDGRALVEEVAAAGLTGRGGAGFPTARKLAEVSAGRAAVVVANGAEGEPASAKDKTLLANSPHLVLDGLVLVAAAVGASRAIVYTGQSSVDGIRAAVAKRADARQVEIIVAPDAFIAGEESAVVSAIEGRLALPRDKVRLVVHSGVSGAPTCVQNVETLALLALIARHGASWFRSHETSLTTVTGAVAHPSVLEVPRDGSLSTLLAWAGGPSEPLRAVLVGGYHGAWIPASDLDIPMSREGLAHYGAAPGAGVVVALPSRACPLEYSAGIASYLAAQSAGQCGPCVNGLPRIADTLRRLAERDRNPHLRREVERLTALVVGRGACHHPDGSARFVASTMRVFADDVRAHLDGGCVAIGAAR
jgi:NADH:ubiquinone oxidoreductase subunit F (NADH-binding)